MHRQSFSMKIFILFFAFSISLFATTISESLLQIHATLMPKVYLMDYSYKEKIDNNSIVIAIAYNKVDYSSAQSLKEKIEAKYRDGIKSYSIDVKLVPYSQVDKNSANIYYLFPTNSKNIKKVIKKANEDNALTFSYLKDDLQHGIMISVSIGNRVKPILNLNAIKLHNISFRPVLLNISKIYSSTLSSMLYLEYKKSICNGVYT